MNSHIYGVIEKNIYPIHLHDELKLLLPDSNLCSWQIRRCEPDFEIIGKDYIGIEEETMTDETKSYLKNLGFEIFETSKDYNDWLFKFIPEGEIWPC